MYICILLSWKPRSHSAQLYVESLLVRESLKTWSCWGSIRKYSKRLTVRGIRAALEADPAVIPTHSPLFPSSPENQLSPTRFMFLSDEVESGGDGEGGHLGGNLGVNFEAQPDIPSSEG